MKQISLLCMALFAFALTSFKSPTLRTVDETIYGDIGALTGANDVQVIFDRYGNEAGQGNVTFKVDIWFNSEGNYQTYYFTMYNYQTHLEDHVQGSNPTGFAGIKTQPYDLVYW